LKEREGGKVSARRKNRGDSSNEEGSNLRLRLAAHPIHAVERSALVRRIEQRYEGIGSTHVEDDLRGRFVGVRDSVLAKQRDADSFHVLDDLGSSFLESDFGSVRVVLTVEGSDDGDDGGRDIRISSASNGRMGYVGSEDDGGA